MSKTTELRSQGKLLSPILQIGKNGLSDGSIALIDRELEQKGLIKIKFHKTALPDDASKNDRKGLAQAIAAKTQSQVIEQIGNVVVLYRA